MLRARRGRSRNFDVVVVVYTCACKIGIMFDVLDGGLIWNPVGSVFFFSMTTMLLVSFITRQVVCRSM
jgi:hypothetical protein